MATGTNGIATRSDVNGILSGAFTNDLNKCVLISEIISNKGLQYKSANQSGRLALYSNISLATSIRCSITMSGRVGTYFSQPTPSNFMRHIVSTTGTVFSASSSLDPTEYTFAYQGDLKLNFDLPSNFLERVESSSIILISFAIGITGGGSFTTAPYAELYAEGPLLVKTQGTIGAGTCNFNIRVGINRLSSLMTALKNDTVKISFS